MTAANVIVSGLVVHHNSTGVLFNPRLNGFSNITRRRFECSSSPVIILDVRYFSRISLVLGGTKILYFIALYNAIFDR